METYRCVRCGVLVAEEDRASHAATSAHQGNGGSAVPADEDWEPAPPDGDDTRGTSWTR